MYSQAASREEWMWYCRFGHLNFKDLDHMQKQGMMLWLPAIQAPVELC
jgi:hypothetical protein